MTRRNARDKPFNAAHERSESGPFEWDRQLLRITPKRDIMLSTNADGYECDSNESQERVRNLTFTAVGYMQMLTSRIPSLVFANPEAKPKASKLPMRWQRFARSEARAS